MSQRINKNLQMLAEEALREIEGLRAPIIQFCAPISTGGLGSTEDNIECLLSFINHFQNIEGLSIFNQLKYERKMDAILENHSEYDYPLLEHFYQPIFLSKKIDGLVFLPLWESSTGCKWEYDFAKSINLPTCVVEDTTGKEILKFYNTLLERK